MPVRVAKSGDKFRVVEADTGAVATNAAGTAVDGGGHTSKGKASAQARAVNASLEGKKRGLDRIRNSARSGS